MNPEPMKREDLEAKVTALLLGEMPDNEAALLRELIARDAGVARLHGQLKLTLDLLRETAAEPEPAPSPPLKLSSARREKLLAQFKTVAPREFAPAPKPMMRWQFMVGVVAALVVLAGLMLPHLASIERTSSIHSYSTSSFPTLGLNLAGRGEEPANRAKAPATPPATVKSEPAVSAPAPSQIVLPAPPDSIAFEEPPASGASGVIHYALSGEINDSLRQLETLAAPVQPGAPSPQVAYSPVEDGNKVDRLKVQKEMPPVSGKFVLEDKKDAGVFQSAPPLAPQTEVQTISNIFSTFSLNVSDAAFKLAQASLQNGVMPDAAGIRSEEFINAFDYRDPEPAPGAPIGFAWECAAWSFAHHRDLLRFSVKTAAQGRQAGRPLNLVLLLDKSGSMERADRVEIIHQALRALASQLNARDTLSVVVFARTARLWVDGVPGSQAGGVADGLSRLTPEGGTNLEEAMKLAYATALRHYQAGGENRVVLLTDGAANLGNIQPDTLKQTVEANRKQGLALDCFGVGWDDYNDNLLETLSRTGHGRYGFINTPEEAATEFAGKLAGALRVAASDVKVQVEFNPNRVVSWRQIGYAKHQLAAAQFRDNAVAAAQIGAAESGNALYTVEIAPAGDGPLCTVRVRFRLPGTTDYQEHAWDVPYTGTAVTLDHASPAMRLAATAAAFSEWLAGSPFAGDVTPDQLLACLRGVPEVYGADGRPKNLEWMIRQAKSISGK
jgi:Mg-chelatase subunit ChlD